MDDGVCLRDSLDQLCSSDRSVPPANEQGPGVLRESSQRGRTECGSVLAGRSGWEGDQVARLELDPKYSRLHSERQNNKFNEFIMSEFTDKLKLNALEDRTPLKTLFRTWSP